jgi:hypothetical protein
VDRELIGDDTVILHHGLCDAGSGWHWDQVPFSLTLPAFLLDPQSTHLTCHARLIFKVRLHG